MALGMEWAESPDSGEDLLVERVSAIAEGEERIAAAAAAVAAGVVAEVVEVDIDRVEFELGGG
jgi:hypothetical protein